MTFENVVEQQTLQTLPRTAPRRNVESDRNSYQDAMRSQMFNTAAGAIATVVIVVACFGSAIA
ncbi:MAG: hypothetical protein HOM68_24350 [Gemmatimonadetes bacterium]|jgi:hypothetical protein|nr:hypothetical protein [Gemmatimonadota bacterium]MBT5059700.1 hypothetical protein [Gemmatimonadota bacterium]MBT5146166.1 hypothetical protein [Gemmatimonadota bacterium]MBT5590809.1 hypothetical protein [Gemmatimonadota bacterium]MBT5961303.1 hypothetical protein [Gemmatimonadota bacterium]